MTWTAGEYELLTVDGTGHGRSARWRVTVRPDTPGVIRREVRVDGADWDADREGWAPEPRIWPTWSPSLGEDSGAGAPLQGVHDYWSEADDRLRDSAKWLAAVIGASLAALVGTSPLADVWAHRPPKGALWFGLAGIVCLGVTLALVLRVIRPTSVAFADVQNAEHFALRKWRRVVEAQQDLYLPAGVKTLTGLRQSMIIEEVTLVALANASAGSITPEETHTITQAQAARAARLKELRDAAARVATIGEFYRVRQNSTFATWVGLIFGVAGTILVVAAFAWPRG
jgi:hypothetical protein